ncbi:hypothetical protein AHAS_Ahas13G0167600 [Arachis hypogaea]
MQEAVLPEEVTSYSFTSAIWRGFVPPMVELFSWFVLIERVWGAWLYALGREWSVPGTLKQHFESWTTAAPRKDERKRWLIGFFAVIWEIWLERNNRVFQNKGSGVQKITNRSFVLSDEWIGGASFGC